MIKIDVPKSNLPEFTTTAMKPIYALLIKLNDADRNPVLAEATLATCEAMNLTEEAFYTRVDDPTRIKTILPILEIQTKLSVDAHIFAMAQKEKLDRRVETYLRHPGKTDIFICTPDPKDVRNVMSEVTYRLTVEDKIPEADLDGKKQSLLHEHVTSYLFVRQIENGTLEFQPPNPLQTALALRQQPPPNTIYGL